MDNPKDLPAEIILVEDSQVEAEILRRNLVNAGHRVTMAKNGVEGLQAIRKRPPDLVMSDIQMPLMNGYQLCWEIKHDEVLRNIPVILLTGLSEPEDIIEALKVGADSYITKPFVVDIMQEHIRSLLANPISRMCSEERRSGKIEYNGKRHLITTDNQQTLNLLLSVYQNTIAQNRELLNTRNQLRQLNNSLDQKVQERTAALQQSEVRLRTILNTALDAFIIIDSSGLITAWNTEAERLFGRSSEDVLGKNLTGLIIPPAHRDAHERGMRQFMETGEGAYIGGRMEVTAMHISRGEFPVELSITAIREGSQTFFSAFVRDITERKLTEAKIRHLAYHDQLTELPNRELFYDRLSQSISQARRKQNLMALLFLDLDGFKTVNDNFGHEAGDIVLKAVALRLQACVRSVDTVARLGGDEFTIILCEVEKAGDVANVAEKIIQKLAEPVFLYDELKCSIGASIGISIYPEDGYELDKLMSSADSAMYESKACGKNTYTFFKDMSSPETDPQSWIVLDESHLLGVPEIDAQHQELVSIINRLNNAVKHNAPAEAVTHQFDELISYTRFHFESEERLMDQYGYHEDDAHRQIHQRLLGQANYLRGKFIQGGELLVLQLIKDWLLAHVMDMDKPLAAYLIQQGINSVAGK